MPTAFLSYAREDAEIVSQTYSGLRARFIDAWIDQENLPRTGGLHRNILEALQNSKYVVLFISKNFITSDYCKHEVDQTITNNIQGKSSNIVVLLDSIDNIKKHNNCYSTIHSIIDNNNCILFDPNNPDIIINEVATAINQKKGFGFNKIALKKISDIEFYEITFDIFNTKDGKKFLPENFLEKNKVDICSFITEYENNTKNSSHALPVAFNGPIPNWLLINMTLPFLNRRSIFIYNAMSKKYICANALPGDTDTGKFHTGSVLSLN